MSVKRTQNIVAESRFALPITAMYAILVCLACGLIQKGMWMQMGCIAVSTYLMVELNNINALIRIHSRIVPCSFLVLAMASNFLIPSIDGSVAQLCFIVFYSFFFRAYQDRESVGWIFYSFAFLGIASILFIQVLYFVPILWILMKFNIMAMSWRTFFASIIGLVAPYWFWGGYMIYVGNANRLLNHFKDLAIFGNVFDYSNVNEHQIITFLYVFILAITGIIHFLRNSYNDKIRTRMLYETFITIDICCVVFIVLQPKHYDLLLRLMMINTAPLIAHFIALTKTKVTNIAFYIIILATLIITAYNLWIHSFKF